MICDLPPTERVCRPEDLQALALKLYAAGRFRLRAQTSVSISGNSESGRMEIDGSRPVRLSRALKRNARTTQSFLPCTQYSSICSAMARSSSDAFAIARL